MTNNGTAEAIAGLPVPIEPPRARPALTRLPLNADFLSQLIAARQQLACQRQRRREQPLHAVAAYSAGARIAERRIPAGYRRSLFT